MQPPHPLRILCVTSPLTLPIDKEERYPLILRGLDIGPCSSSWSSEYLRQSQEANKLVKVHKSREFRLDFRTKNFNYETLSFGQLIDKCEKDKEHYWYLRSLGEDPR